MDHRPRPFSFNRLVINAVLACVVSSLFGCSYMGYYARKTHWHVTYENIPSMSALSKYSPEDSLVVGGRIVNHHERKEPLLLVAVSNQYKQNEKVALVQVPASATFYMAFLPKGDYQLLLFADLDKNGDFEWNELIGRASMSVSPENAKGGAVLEGPPITVDFNHAGQVDFHLSETVRPTGYIYASLDDEFFAPRFGTMGLYNPTELISHTQGFIFGLEDFDAEKTMVLFVHGISGTPRDWKFIVDGLDRSRFQPFFFFYPSGLRLDKLGTLLAEIINAIQTSPGNGRHKIVLAAHSMGGLVTMSALNKLAEEGFPSSVKLYCSFSAPYGGIESARTALENAPAVVPAWRDIATDSDFIKYLSGRRLPKSLPFYLYFTYSGRSVLKGGGCSDGSVALQAQLEPSVQKAATRIFGFNETHIGVLNSTDARESFLRLLDMVEPPRSGEPR